MKPPEEIKKGLACCSKVEGCQNRCPYYDLGSGSICVPAMTGDALAYIQQLESHLAQVERENKAMLHDMARYTMCGSCKHFADDGKCPQKDECVYGEIGRFEWRGVCAENTEEETE